MTAHVRDTHPCDGLSQGKCERFLFTKKFRKFPLGCRWNTTLWFVPMEIFRNKRNSRKGSPVFPVETSQWKFVFHLQISRFYHQFHTCRGLIKRPGLRRLPRMEFVTNGTRSSQTKIPNRNFPKFVVNGKRPVSQYFCTRLMTDP